MVPRSRDAVLRTSRGQLGARRSLPTLRTTHKFEGQNYVRLKTHEELLASGWVHYPDKPQDPERYRFPHDASVSSFYPCMREAANSLTVRNIQDIWLHGKQTIPLGYSLSWTWYREMFVDDGQPRCSSDFRNVRTHYRLKTKEELLASGWGFECGYFYSRKHEEMPRLRLEMFPLAAAIPQIELLMMFQSGRPHTCGTAWHWHPEMFTTAPAGDGIPPKTFRLKTDEELLADGWELRTDKPLPYLIRRIRYRHFSRMNAKKRAYGEEHLTDLDFEVIKVRRPNPPAFMQGPKGCPYLWDIELFVELSQADSLATREQRAYKDCECHKEKFNFISHERWCPDFVPFSQMKVKVDVAAPVKPTDFMTTGDLAAFCHPNDR